MYEFKGLKIHWLGHSGFFIDNSKKLYIDPYNIDQNIKADIVLITHSHHDHCSIADLNKVISEETILVCPADCLSKLNHLKVKDIRIMEPGQSITIEGVLIESVPAYTPAKQFHPRGNNWMGYILTLDSVRIYHAGDTDLIDEMAGIKCDIALLPVSGTYVMTAEEAAEATRQIKAKIAVPMHYGGIVGTEEDAQLFKEKAGCEVIILKKE